MFCTIKSNYTLKTSNNNRMACYDASFFSIGYNSRITQFLNNLYHCRVVLNLRITEGCGSIYYSDYIGGFWNCKADNKGSICCNPHSFEPGSMDMRGLGKPWYKELKCCKEMAVEGDWIRCLK